MDLSPEEEFKIPLLDKFCSPELKKRIRSSGPYIAIAALIAFFIAGFALLAWCLIASAIHDEIQPEIELKSLLVCPTNRESVIWDLKFDIVNPCNDSLICISGGFKVSIFPYNQTKLLTKATLSFSPACIGPTKHTSVIGLVEAYSCIQDLNEYLDPTSGTIGLDLKIHKDGYEFVCGDAKVALSSNSSLSCGSMVGDPFACSYDPHSVTFRWSWVWEAFFLLVLLVLLVLVIAFLLCMCRHVQS